MAGIYGLQLHFHNGPISSVLGYGVGRLVRPTFDSQNDIVGHRTIVTKWAGTSKPARRHRLGLAAGHANRYRTRPFAHLQIETVPFRLTERSRG